MPKAIAQELQELLAGLSRSEKRYVRLELERSGDTRRPNWLRLFDRLTGESPTPPGPAERRSARDLRDRVLQALVAYYRANNPEHQLLDCLMEVDVLLRKEAHGLARNRMDAAWKLAGRMAWNPYWARMVQLDTQLTRRHARLPELQARVDGFERELHMAFGRQERALGLHLIANRMAGWLLAGGRYDVPADRDALEAMAAHPFLAAEPVGNEEALIRYHEIWGTIAFHRRQYPQSHRHRQRVDAMVRADPDRIRNAPHSYIAVLNNLVISAMRVGDTRAIEDGLARMRDFPERYRVASREDLDATVFSRSYSIELYHLLDVGDRARLERAVRSVEEGLDGFGTRLPPFARLDFRYLLARSRFTLGDDARAQEHLDRILQKGRQGWRRDLQVLARILNLLLRFEDGEYRLLDSALTAFPRYAAQARFRSRSARLLLRALRTLNHQEDRTTRVRTLEKLVERLDGARLPERERVQWVECGAEAWLRRYGLAWARRDAAGT